MKIKFCWREIFENSIIHKPSLGSCEVPIGSAVLMIIGYKQTTKQTDRQAKYIYIDNHNLDPVRKSDNDSLED